MSPHGTISRYRTGCRDTCCRTAHKIYMARYRARRERNGGHITEQRIVGGHLNEPAEPLRRMIRDLRRLPLTWQQIADATGLSQWPVRKLAGGHTRTVQQATAAAIRGTWDLYCAPVEADTRRFPADPLIGHVRRMYGSLRASGVSHQLNRLCREGMSWGQCEDWAHRFGMLPEELWPEWLEVA